MTPMLEKIARAIEDAMASDDNHPHDIARAALLAMREPDLDVISAMFDRLDCGELGEDYDTTDVWQVGIDAILAQPSTPADVTPA